MKKQDFLNPNSMLTPGIAGGTVMLITNALISQFDLSGPKVALGLSFLVGILVFLAKNVPFWQRIIYYVLNSLIIFAMATGTAFVGNKAQAAATGSKTGNTSASRPTPTLLIVTNTFFTNGRVASVTFTNEPHMEFRVMNELQVSPAGFFKKW